MKSIYRILLILLFPAVSFADGISFEATTLKSAQFAFLVKLIALDSARHLAKVKILKKFTSPSSLKGQDTGVQPAKVFSDKEDTQYSSVEWTELEKQPEVVLRFKGKTEARAGKWVIERRYWEASDQVKVGKTVFAVDTGAGYEWVPYTKDREAKISLFYDEAKRKATFEKLDVKALVLWLKDQDLRSFAVAELESRNEMNVINLLKPGMQKDISGILFEYVSKKEPAFRKVFLNESLNLVLKELRERKIDPDLIVSFTEIFSYSADQRPDFDQEAELMGQLKVPAGENAVRRAIDQFHYEIKTKLDSGKPAPLEKALDQVIQIYELMGTDSTRSPRLSLDRFYEHLKGAARAEMFRKLASSLSRIGHQHGSSGEIQSMLFQLKKTPDLEAAKILMKVNHQKAPTNIKVAVLEAVFVSFEQSAEWKDPKIQKSVLDFLDQYIDPKIPDYLSDEIMKKYGLLKSP